MEGGEGRMGMPKDTYLCLIISVVWELFQGGVFGRFGLQAGLKIQITDSKEFVGVRCMVNML